MQPSPVPPPPPPYQPPPPPYQPPPPPAPAPRSGTAKAVVGLLLMLPAVIALVVGYLVPTIRTALWSLQVRAFLSDENEYEWAGFDNYDAILGDTLGPLAFTLVIAFLPLLTLLVVAPLLALLAHTGGRAARLVVRLALTIPTVLFAPTALAIALRFDRFDFESEFPRIDLSIAVWLGVFGLVCGVGVTVFLAVLRGGAPGRSVWPAGLVVAAIGALAVLALALQAFTFPYVVTGGGPRDETTTPMLETFLVGLQIFDSGAGSAAGMLVLVPVLLLGIAAALLVVFSGLRIEPQPAAPRPPVRAGAVVGAVLVLVVVLAVTLYGLWPWLTGLGRFTVDGGDSAAAESVVNTWLPPFVSTVIGVGLAAVAGFGIGALRPAGRFSELLLLPFAPWLFVGIGPLFLVKWDAASEGDRVDTFLGHIPPIWLVVPALFVFTLLFRGLAAHSANLGQVVLRALPMVGLVGAATWLVQSQSLLWGLLVSFEDPNAQVWALQIAGELVRPDAIPLGLILPIPAILVFALGLGLLHVLYLDRLAMRVGRDR